MSNYWDGVWSGLYPKQFTIQWRSLSSIVLLQSQSLLPRTEINLTWEKIETRLRQVTGLCVQPAGLDTLLEYRGAGFNALGLECCSASLGNADNSLWFMQGSCVMCYLTFLITFTSLFPLNLMKTWEYSNAER